MFSFQCSVFSEGVRESGVLFLDARASDRDRPVSIFEISLISESVPEGSEAALVGWVQPTDFQGLCRWVAPTLQPSNQASETDSDPVGRWHSLALDGNFSQGLHRPGRRSRPGPEPAGMPCSGARSLERSSHLPSRKVPCGQRSGVTDRGLTWDDFAHHPLLMRMPPHGQFVNAPTAASSCFLS